MYWKSQPNLIDAKTQLKLLGKRIDLLEIFQEVDHMHWISKMGRCCHLAVDSK